MIVFPFCRFNDHDQQMGVTSHTFKYMNYLICIF